MSTNFKASQKFNSLQSRQPLGSCNQNLQSGSDFIDYPTISRRSWLKRSLTFGRSVASDKSLVTSTTSPEDLAISVAACSGSSVSTILAQVSGGPLRAIRLIQEQPYPILTLYFVNENHMRYFKYYIQRRKCIVNGIPLVQCEPTCLDSDESLTDESSVSKFPSLARRSLEISYCISTITRNLHITHCEISPSYVKTIFSRVGQVLQVRPMFRPNSISYVIDFASIASAIKAKQLFEEEVKIDRNVRRQNRDFNKFAGLHDWSVRFLPDSTELTCFF